MWTALISVVVAFFTIRWVLSWFFPAESMANFDRFFIVAGDFTIKLGALLFTGLLLWAFVYLPFFSK